MNTRAVVLFVGDPRREELRKGLPPKFLAALHHEQIRQLRALEATDVFLARDTSRGFFLTGPTTEIEFDAPSLGDKVRGALGHCFSLGYSTVAVMAADVAPVATSLIRSALPRATSVEAVLGRSPDGGFYIAAFAALPAIDWQSLPWHSSATADALVAALRDSGTAVILLDELPDIDSAADAERAIALIRDVRLRSRLLSRLRSRTPATRLACMRIQPPEGGSARLRAPPVA